MSRTPHDTPESSASRISRSTHTPPALGNVIHSAARGVALAGGLVSGLLHRVLWSSRRMRPPRREVGSVVADAPEHMLLGRSKDEVYRTLGAPPTATMEGTPAAADDGRPAFWQATIWYYPYDVEQRTAMAVHFDRGIVDRIDMIPISLGQ